MDNQAIQALLEAVSSGSIDVNSALSKLTSLPYATESLSYATLDTGRKARTGFAEVVYGAGKLQHSASELRKLSSHTSLPFCLHVYLMHHLKHFLLRFRSIAAGRKAGPSSSGKSQSRYSLGKSWL